MKNIEEVARRLFDAMSRRNKNEIKQLFIENSKVYINGAVQSLEFIGSLPPFITLDFVSTSVVETEENSALVLLNWEMRLPGSIGTHKTYLYLTQEEVFMINAMYDFGTEVKNK